MRDPDRLSATITIMASYANPSTYEQQNDDSLNRLFNKVHSLVCLALESDTSAR